jgi:hypothetical protein
MAGVLAERDDPGVISCGDGVMAFAAEAKFWAPDRNTVGLENVLKPK